jgi:carboxypeptidase C (cathepsin A)
MIQYGGHWAPAIMAHFESQNRKIRDGTLQTCLHNMTLMNLDTLGFTNGCVDSKIEAPLYLQMAFNNTYGLQAIAEGVYKEAMNNLTKPSGCNDLIEICRDYAAADPENTGTNTTINDACAVATTYCWQFVQGAYAATSQVSTTRVGAFSHPNDFTKRNAFDMSRKTLAVFPPEYIIGFMNQEWVREELGVPVNFSISGPTIVPEYFGVTGDPFHVSIDTINYVAQSGIKVAMIFGDRDYRCNCKFHCTPLTKLMH